MKIKIFITGGTIDNLEYDDPKHAPNNQESLIPGLFKQSRITVPYDIEEIMFKDSKFVDDKDRELIAEKCKQCFEDKIIITHGTATMPLTAKYLDGKKINKTIVLLGAAFPANQQSSDALFNIGAAFSAVQFLAPGVYIVMNGQIFNANNVKKEKSYFHNEH